MTVLKLLLSSLQGPVSEKDMVVDIWNAGERRLVS